MTWKKLTEPWFQLNLSDTKMMFGKVLPLLQISLLTAEEFRLSLEQVNGTLLLILQLKKIGLHGNYQFLLI